MKGGGSKATKVSKKSTNKGSEMRTDTTTQEIIERKFHGSRHPNYANQKNLLSFVDSFLQMYEPFACLVPNFASFNVSTTTHNDVDAGSEMENTYLDLSTIMRQEGDRLQLGKNANVVRSQLHFKNLSTTRNKSFATGRSLQEKMKQTIGYVRKLQAFEASYRNDTGEIPSGSVAKDLINSVLEQAWALEKYNKGKSRGGTNALDDADNSEADLDEVDLQIVEDAVTVPENYEAPPLPEYWIPNGWPSYVVFVCESTRCTDKLLHVFTGVGPGAKSRVESRSMIKEDKSAMHEAESLSASGMKSKRGQNMEQQNFLLSNAAKRSTEKSLRLTALSSTVSKKMDQLSKQRQDTLAELKAYVEMDIGGDMKQSLLNDLATIREKVNTAREEHETAIAEQIQFEKEDTLGSCADDILLQSLGSNANMKRKKQKKTSSPAPSSSRARTGSTGSQSLD